MTLDAPPCLGSDHVIKTVALGVVCLAGLGAIAAAAKKSTSAPPEIIRPVVAGNKADRLSPPVNQDTAPLPAEKVEVAYVQPSEQGQTGRPPAAAEEVPVPAPLPDTAPRLDTTSRPDTTRRQWHDPRHAKARMERRSARSTKQAKMRPAEPPPAQVSALKECRSDGLEPLLRRLNLSPPCN
jgi:hypothetical protein